MRPLDNSKKTAVLSQQGRMSKTSTRSSYQKFSIYIVCKHFKDRRSKTTFATRCYHLSTVQRKRFFGTVIILINNSQN